MEPELSSIYFIVFKVGLWYRLGSQGKGEAVGGEGQSLPAAVITTLNMAGVINKMAQTMLGYIHSVHQSGSNLVTSAEAEQNLSRRKIYVKYARISSYIFS